MRAPSGLPSRDELEAGIEAEAERLSIRLPESCPVRALAAHLRLLYVWNPRVNLTAIREPAEGLRRHTLEALEAAPYLPEDGMLADLGSGNGYPALPCLSIRPLSRGVLFESVARKVDFLSAAIRECGLGGRVEASQTRFEGPESLPAGARTVTMRGFPSPALWCVRVFEAESVQRVIAWLSREDAALVAESAGASGLSPTVVPLRAHATGALLVLDRS